MNLLDRLATYWLTRRRRLVSIKRNPTRIEVPFPISEEDAEKIRSEWVAAATGRGKGNAE